MSFKFLTAQRTLLSDPGRTYTNSDGPTFDTYGPVDISTCSSVRFELNYNFSLPWEGSGNMESSDECNFNPPGCPGDPNNPLHPDCTQCWDFLWAQFMIDGVQAGGDLIGEAGTTNAEQSGSITLDYCTMGLSSSAQINVTTQTWANNESVTFSSIMIICYDGIPDPSANPDPICDNETLNLNGNVMDPGVVSSSNWSGPGTINAPGSLNTSVENIPPGTATYTLSVTDVNGCQTEGRVMVTVYETPQAFPAGPLEECETAGGQAIFDLTGLDATVNGGSGTMVKWYRDAGQTNQILNPGSFLSGTTTVYAVSDNGFCQSEVIMVELIVLERPEANPASMEVCEDVPGSGVGTFDLSSLSDLINGGSGLMVRYYRDPGGVLPIGSPYQGPSGTIYAQVVDGPCESDIVTVQLIVKPSPNGRDIQITKCEDLSGLGTARIDLNDYRNDIASGPGLQIDFFEDDQFFSRARNPFDAGLGTTVVFARVSNGECDSRPIRITITILPTPGIIPGEIEVCENPAGSGVGFFELDSLHIYVIGNQQGLMVNWYVDSLKTMRFNNPYLGGDTTIFAESTNGVCSSEVVRVDLRTIMKPVASPYRDTACADQSGTAYFDLSKYDHIISGDTSMEEVFYASDSLFTNQVNINFRTDDTTIYARVERGECFSDVVQLVLVAIPGPILSGINDVTVCDSLILPEIPGINLTGNEGFFLYRELGGRKYLEGESIRKGGMIYYSDKLEDCLDIDSFLLEIVPHPEAGDSNTVSACEGAMVDLTQYVLNGDPGGQFFDTDNTGALNGNIFNTSGLAGSSFTFKYEVPGERPCGPDSAYITVNVETILSAGRDTLINFCFGDSIDLLAFIAGDQGGTFIDPANTGALDRNLWRSVISGEGKYSIIYRIGDGIVCPIDEAEITVTIWPAIRVDKIRDTVVCDEFILPQLTGINADLADYYTGPNGTGMPLREGDTLTTDQEVFIYGFGRGYCEEMFSFSVDILETSRTLIDDLICFEDIVTVGSERFDRNNPSGTVTFTGGAVNGCDSIVEIDLEFRDQAIQNIERTFCRGQSLTINGTVYDQNNPVGQEILMNGSYHGCDSIININLTFDDYAVGEFGQTICSGDTILINGREYFEGRSTGSDTLLGQGAGGCDSIVNIQVSFHISENNLDTMLCEGDQLLVNGTIYDESNPVGVEILSGQGQFGCDSVIRIAVSYHPPASELIDRILCFGDSVVVNGSTYNETNPSGREVIQGGSVRGCDSIIDIDLRFQATSDENINFDICEGDSTVINGKTYFSGRSTGRDTLPGASISGCDSVLIIDLNVLENVETTYSDVLCPEDELNINGTIYNRNSPSGREIYPGLAANGCDSIVYIDLQFEGLEIIPSRNELEIELGDSATVSLSTNFNVDSIYWIPTTGLSCADCLNPIISPASSTTYTVVMISENGCEIRATIHVEVDLFTNVYIPNSFSPNGDNLNDRLKVYVKPGKVEAIEEFSIYSRWGELIYTEEGTSPDNSSHAGWNGTFNGEVMDPGVFVYHIELTLIGGRSMRLRGTVTLIH